MSDKFSKLYIALKFRLKGMAFYDALNALELGKEIHIGFRKDGITPSFQHQLEIAHHIFTLKGIWDLEGAIICALLHDTDEDFPHKIPTGKLEEFGPYRVATIRRLNKHTAPNLEKYFDELSNDQNGSIVKGADRVNNFQSMNRGKFSIEKQIKYSFEVQTYFLPMLKQARKNFPDQMDAYYNIEHMLKSQYELIQLFIQASTKDVSV